MLAILTAGLAAPSDYHATAQVKPPSAQVESSFARLDANGDGALSRKEFHGRRERHFDEIDVNGDGKIDHAELLDWFQRRDARDDRPGKHLGRGRGKGELKI